MVLQLEKNEEVWLLERSKPFLSKNKTKTKQNMTLWHRPKTAYQHRHVTPTVKNGGGTCLICACFATMGPEHL